MIVTNCNKCCFYKDKTCEFNVPDILFNTFPMVFDDKKFQNDNIYDFYCPYARTQEWLDLKMSDESSTINGVMDEVLVQRPSYMMIYFINDNLENFEHNIKILSNNQHGYIYLVSKSNLKIDSKKYISILEDNKVKNWKYHSMVDDEMTECEIIDMILDSSKVETELIYIINNEFRIYQQDLETVLNSFNLLRYHEVVFLPSDIFTFHNIIIPKQLWKHTSKRIGLAFDSIIDDSTIIRLSI